MGDGEVDAGPARGIPSPPTRRSSLPVKGGWEQRGATNVLLRKARSERSHCSDGCPANAQTGQAREAGERQLNGADEARIGKEGVWRLV